MGVPLNKIISRIIISNGIGENESKFLARENTPIYIAIKSIEHTRTIGVHVHACMLAAMYILMQHAQS